MMNNNTQVSPRNGVDFSKIRKAQQGTKISKYADGVSGITYRAGTTWQGSMFNLIVGDIKAMLSNPSLTSELKSALIQELNELQGAYAKIRAAHPNFSPVLFDLAVKDYLQQIINKYNFVNTKGVAYGNNSDHQRYIYGQSNPTKRTTGDNAGASNDWSKSADGYMSGITRDRTMLGYDGDWNENSTDFQNWQSWLHGIGLETYMDTDKAYKLRNWSNNNSNLNNLSTLNDNSQENQLATSSQENHLIIPNQEIQSRNYTPDQYSAPFKFKPQPFTSPITNGVIAGLGLAANKHVYDNEAKKKVPLLEAPYHQYRTGSYKSIVDAYNQAASDIQTQSNIIASNSSDLRLSLNIQLEGAKLAAEKRLEGVLKQQEGYNLDRKEAINTAYFNSDATNRIANINRLNLVADWNRRMDAKSKYLLQRNAIWADNIMKNRTDYGQWKANEENERDAALSAYNQHLANLDMQNAKKPYQNLLANPTQSNAFNQVYYNAFRDFNSKRETDPNWITANRDLVDIFKTGTDVDKRNAFLTYLQTHGDSDYGKLFTQGYNSELTTLKNKYIQDTEDIQNNLSALAPSFRNTYTTEGWYNPKRLGKQYQRRFAEGGILKMRNGSRFVDYLEHNRKALKDQKLTTMENVKLAQKTLQKQLEAIDRETLILLRSIFK